MQAHRQVHGAAGWPARTAGAQSDAIISPMTLPDAGMSDELPVSPGSFFDALEVEDDEVMIVTLLVDRQQDGRVILRHGTALFAPPECGRLSWGVWASRHQRKTMGLCPETAPATFVHQTDTWLAARAVLSLDRAREWLLLLQGGATSGLPAKWPGADGLPAFEADVREPSSLIRILPGTDTAVSGFLASAKRPALGTVWASEERPQLLVPNMVEHEGAWYDPVLCLLGILVPSEGVPQAVPPPFGLFVGRLERRAWLTDLTGDGPAFEALHVYIGWDPDRLDLTDLVVDLEQFIDGALVNQLRVPLEDTAISNGVRRAGACVTSLPTFGRGTASRVSLTTRDGALLDRIGPHPLVESAQIAMTTNGQEQAPIVIGSRGPPPGLEERAVRQEQVAQQVASLASLGAEGRQLVERAAAEERLRLEIDSAREELLVHDPFFGQDPEDWRLLDDVPVPVRVVTAKIAKDTRPTIGSHVQARYRPKAPMHERFWIWRGGGLSLGGSPTTLGHSPVWIRRVSAADSDVMRSVFEGLWSSEHFRDVPRQP